MVAILSLPYPRTERQQRVNRASMERQLSMYNASTEHERYMVMQLA
jgi:hypothetical protein